MIFIFLFYFLFAKQCDDEVVFFYCPLFFLPIIRIPHSFFFVSFPKFLRKYLLKKKFCASLWAE